MLQLNIAPVGYWNSLWIHSVDLWNTENWDYDTKDHAWKCVECIPLFSNVFFFIWYTPLAWRQFTCILEKSLLNIDNGITVHRIWRHFPCIPSDIRHIKRSWKSKYWDLNEIRFLYSCGVRCCRIKNSESVPNVLWGLAAFCVKVMFNV